MPFRPLVFNLLCLFTLFSHVSALAIKDKKDPIPDKLDGIFQKSLKEFNVPGMSVAIVKDGNVVLSKGYGVRNSETKEKVDDKTLFAIASNTKAFTSAALAILVDEGRLKWTDKVREHLPYFSLYSPFVSEEMTIADLLCHRSGLATFSGDLIWYGSTHSREEVIKRARFLKPTMGFRDGYGYSNIMFLAAGEVLENVTGRSWDVYIKDKFFAPLGMIYSTTSIRDFKSETNLATPHNEVKGNNVPISWVNWDNIAPAGSINSCAHDLSKWLMLQLGKGTFNERIFWNEQRSYEMWENITPKPVSKWQRENMPTRHFNGYGLGWELMDYHGYKVMSHGGGYDGMISKTVLVPELNLGFVILTNNINSLPSCLSYEILDEYLGVTDQQDWLGIFLKFKKDDEKAAERAEVDGAATRVPNTKPTLKLEAYCGTYTSEMYGDVIITLGNTDLLKIDFKPTPLFKGTLSHWHYDTFELAWSTQMMLPKGKATFVLGSDGKPIELKIAVDNPYLDFTELVLLRK